MHTPIEASASQPVGTPPYLALAGEGRNEWWRYAIALFVIAFMWLVVGSMPLLALAVAVMIDDNPATTVDATTGQFAGIHPGLPFIAIMLSFLCFVVGVYLAVRFVHQRRFLSLVTPGAVRWGRLVEAFALWFMLSAATAMVEALLYPGRYQLTFQPLQFVIFLFFALVLIPVQTSAEEFFFRGYLLQSAGLLLRNPIILSVISGAVFMVPHLANPEMAVDILLLPVYYFLFGAFLAFVSLKDNGLELALAIHAANNLFAGLFANYAGSALATPAIFTANELDPVYTLVTTPIAMTVLYFWFFWPVRKTA